MQIGTSGLWGDGVKQMINYRDQDVRGQGHTRPKMDFEAWIEQLF